ncbi:VQ motif-containing protein 4 [Camellia lanceoleosa]|uniref:VQ motif-containing protein 4 n=1 Tax=Camellia lanceoleosa TaxID=1840588 RepID=A0ACC0GZT9_9ERIC|nr:VQ motif-containing protein 4 [Camellia lanceoleosa]
MESSTLKPLLSPQNPLSRSESNPYPTTFVQADTTTFKQVVQMLTGSLETAKQASKPSSSAADQPPSKSYIPLIKSTGQKNKDSIPSSPIGEILKTQKELSFSPFRYPNVASKC